MSHDLTFCSTFLKEEKWISKMDFIYQLKVNCDCTEVVHSLLLSSLYRLHFDMITRTRSGNILVRWKAP